jgi:hypothetical protein
LFAVILLRSSYKTNAVFLVLVENGERSLKRVAEKNVIKHENSSSYNKERYMTLSKNNEYRPKQKGMPNYTAAETSKFLSTNQSKRF